MERIYALDSLKFFLIILVIYGHIYSGEQGMYGVRFVYLFHMPLFAYISGFFSSFCSDSCSFYSKNKKLLLYYVGFQIVYYIICRFLEIYQMSFTQLLFKPFIHLWYLLSLFYWRLFLFIFGKNIKKHLLLSLCFSFCFCLICGFLNINDEFAIGKTFVLLPFFMLGFYCRERKVFYVLFKKSFIKSLLSLLMFFVGIIMSTRMPQFCDTYYGHYTCIKDFVLRIIFLLLGLGISYSLCFFCLLLFNSFSQHLQRFFGGAGKYTLDIYLYHIIPIIFLSKILSNFGNTEIEHIFYTLIVSLLTFFIITIKQQFIFLTIHK